MEWRAEFSLYKIADVYHIVDRLEAHRFESILQPFGRRSNFDIV